MATEGPPSVETPTTATPKIRIKLKLEDALALAKNETYEEEEFYSSEIGNENNEKEKATLRRSKRKRTVPQKYETRYLHNHNDEEEEEEILESLQAKDKPHKLSFVNTLLTREFEDPHKVVHFHETGKTITFETLFLKDGFTQPILVEKPTGLGVVVPTEPNFDIDSVAELVGNRDLDVIDVLEQAELDPSWRMENWVDYFNQPPHLRKRILNVISLEFSDTKLIHKVRSPKVVRMVDWIDNVWPNRLKILAPPVATEPEASPNVHNQSPHSILQLSTTSTSTGTPTLIPTLTSTSTSTSTSISASVAAPTQTQMYKIGESQNTANNSLAARGAGEAEISNWNNSGISSEVGGKAATPVKLVPYYPKVQYYCLMSVEGSYTDFHIDFGGTSVWYHVLWGKKVFYLIEPTQENLRLYEKWLMSPAQSDVFFGDRVDHCYRIELHPGNTFFIPSGWIHAVYTPEDSLVFGGNFLHGYAMEMQLRVYEIENKTKTKKKFRFPMYETMLWYAVQQYAQKLREIKGGGTTPVERQGLLAVVERLRSWLNGSDSDKHRAQIPESITNPEDLLYEVKHALAPAEGDLELFMKLKRKKGNKEAEAEAEEFVPSSSASTSGEGGAAQSKPKGKKQKSKGTTTSGAKSKDQTGTAAGSQSPKPTTTTTKKKPTTVRERLKKKLSLNRKY